MITARARLSALILTGIAIASPSCGDTLKVGPNQTYKAPSAAAAVAKNGDNIQIEPGQYFDCAVWNAGRRHHLAREVQFRPRRDYRHPAGEIPAIIPLTKRRGSAKL